MIKYLFTSEAVSEGHPDKVADQISDAVLDEFLAFDKDSKVACETLVTTGQVILAGEVKSTAYVDLQDVARRTINEIGYTKSEYMFDGNSCGVLNAIHEQSPDINQGVDVGVKEEQGAGDQGIMFGYASNETPSYMPLPWYLANLIVKTLADIRKEGKEMPYLRPDSKSQVTVGYDEDNKACCVNTIVVSTQHDDFLEDDEEMLTKIYYDVRNILIPRVIEQIGDEKVKDMMRDENILYYVNPTGKFVIGGPHGDTGLTGRKIIVDTYGGRASHGGGAFSGKDPSKVDRSAAYAARHIAKNLCAAGIADEVQVQLSYAIGVAHPISIYVDTKGTNNTNFTDSEIASLVSDMFDLTPYGIEERLKLRNPIYKFTAAYGHFGREPKMECVQFNSKYELPYDKVVETFTWEKLDYVDKIKSIIAVRDKH